VSTKSILVAACALVDADNRVLLAQRPAGKPMAGLWEFPGGKVEEACLAPLTFASHSYSDFHLLMPLFICRRWQGIVAPLEGQQLAWVPPDRLRSYSMPPADEPLVAHLMALL